MKKTFLVMLCFCLAFICGSCTAVNNEDSFESNELTGNFTSPQIVSTEIQEPQETLDTRVVPTPQDIVSTDVPVTYLTKQQCVEDFDFLFKTLEESYPMFNMVERTFGVKAADVKEKYKDMIMSESDKIPLKEFFEIIYNCVAEFQGQGHLVVFEGFNYWSRYYSLAKLGDIEIEKSSTSLQNEALSYPEAVKTYTYLFLEAKDVYYKLNQDSITKADSVYSNITLRILNPETAYIKIGSFVSSQLEKEVEAILNFYETIKEKKNLIIDLTENGGGSDWYWMTAFVMPNITEQLDTTYYWLAKSSELNKTYFSERNLDKRYVDKATIENLENLNIDDYNSNDLLIKYPYSIPPNSQEKAFDGDIYILTSKRVYSSSESFVMFCKNTKFATLVGTTTGGDGSGLSPMYIALPNTGINFSFSTLLTLNPDGSCNEEYGTEPDYRQEDDETALEACLRTIESRK